MMHRSSCRVILLLSSTPITLLHLEALLPPSRVTLTHQSLSSLNKPSAYLKPFLYPLANSNPRTRLKKGLWRSFCRSYNFTPNLELSREPLILCPPKPPWYTPSSYTISHQLSSPCSRNDPPFATSPLLPTYSPYPTATLLPGLMTRFLAGWERVVQGSTLSVQSVSLLLPSPQLDSGPPTTVPRPTPFFMFLNGVSLTPRHVRLNLSPCSLTLYLSCQPF